MFIVLAFSRRCYFFFDLAFQFFGFDIEPQPVVNAHVLVRDPHQRQPRDQITSPIRKQQLEARDDEKSRGDVVTEAVLAGEEIEEFSFVPATAVFTASDTVFTRLAKDLFVRHRPGDAGNRDRQQKQFENLKAQRRHTLKSEPSPVGERAFNLLSPGKFVAGDWGTTRDY